MSDTEDDFVTYGNALEPLDAENLTHKKPPTIEEQFAYDAQGRRRFHGAFTGGFSAGYFNTVGTRDGWRPQQFKSTRADKAKNVVQQPQDFMDDEDTGEFGIAPTAIRASEDYINHTNKGTKREQKYSSDRAIPGSLVLRELLTPIKERVGVKFLKKMGWRLGQGIGPRLTKREKKQKTQQRQKTKVYGCALPNQHKSGSDTDYSDDEYSSVTFAPDDYEPFRCNAKDNYFGIGYSGLDRRPILGEHINLFEAPAFSIRDKKTKFSVRGQAFGVGAFETEDDDIYAREDMTRYDFSLGGPRKAKSRWSKQEAPRPGCIEGFEQSKEQLPPLKVFPAPVLAKDFEPVHRTKKSRFSPLPEGTRAPRKKIEMNADVRSIIINEDRAAVADTRREESRGGRAAINIIERTLNLHGKEQAAERKRLDEASAAKDRSMSWLDKLSSTTFVKGGTVGSELREKGIVRDKRSFCVGSEPAGIAGDASVARPRFENLDKQRRFEQYTELPEGERRLKLGALQPLSMTDWERDREAEEFERTSRLCQNLEKPSAAGPERRIEELEPAERMAAAAEMKLFGKLTRTVAEWKPEKLVCVRFNVAEPRVGVADEGAKRKRKKFSIFDNLAWDQLSKFESERRVEREPEPLPSTSASSGPVERYERDRGAEGAPESRSVPREEGGLGDDSPGNAPEAGSERPRGEIGKAEDADSGVESKRSDEPPKSRNPQEMKDLYKSIFLSSSDESDAESESTRDVNEEKLKAALIGKNAAEVNVQRNTSPPRGIFAKLDFDALLKRPEKMDIPNDESAAGVDAIAEQRNDIGEARAERRPREDPEMETDKSSLLENAYGPVLPKVLVQSGNSFGQQYDFAKLPKKPKKADDSQWVEKSKNRKKSKKEKKKHKHKERSISKSAKKAKKLKK